MLDTVVREKEAVLSHDASADARFQSAQSVIMQGIRSTMCVPLLHGDTVLGVMMLDSKLATHAFTEKDLALFETVASQAAVAVQNTLFAKRVEQEAVMRERFRRLLSPDIAEQVLSGQLEVKKGGELRETTILFADIRGFTSISESCEPQIVVDALNDYFERMVEIVFRYEGTLDKFIGDEMMVLFGSPVAHPDDPVRAVRAALEMQAALTAINERHAVAEHPAVRDRHRHQHRRGGGGLHRKQPGARVHRHWRPGEHRVSAVFPGQARADPDQRGHGRQARQALRARGAAAPRR